MFVVVFALIVDSLMLGLTYTVWGVDDIVTRYFLIALIVAFAVPIGEAQVRWLQGNPSFFFVLPGRIKNRISIRRHGSEIAEVLEFIKPNGGILGLKPPVLAKRIMDDRALVHEQNLRINSSLCADRAVIASTMLVAEEICVPVARTVEAEFSSKRIDLIISYSSNANNACTTRIARLLGALDLKFKKLPNDAGFTFEPGHAERLRNGARILVFESTLLSDAHLQYVKDMVLDKHLGLDLVGAATIFNACEVDQFEFRGRQKSVKSLYRLNMGIRKKVDCDDCGNRMMRPDLPEIAEEFADF